MAASVRELAEMDEYRMLLEGTPALVVINTATCQDTSARCSPEEYPFRSTLVKSEGEEAFDYTGCSCTWG